MRRRLGCDHPRRPDHTRAGSAWATEVRGIGHDSRAPPAFSRFNRRDIALVIGQTTIDVEPTDWTPVSMGSA
jgi:hypothetical protein